MTTSGLVSAHRAAEGGREALEAAVALGPDYVELDVQECADGALVIFHDDRVRVGRRRRAVDRMTRRELEAVVGPLLGLGEALDVLAGRTKAHIDLKCVAPPGPHLRPERTPEMRAVREVLRRFDPRDAIITTTHDRSVRIVRSFSRLHAPELLVGLSLGAHVGDLRLLGTRWAKPLEAVAVGRLVGCDANLVVCHRRLARAGIADIAHRLGLPLLVWTVDDPGELERWLGDERAWLVTTNRPEAALAARAPGGAEISTPGPDSTAGGE